jgi:hypothetical protein
VEGRLAFANHLIEKKVDAEHSPGHPDMRSDSLTRPSSNDVCMLEPIIIADDCPICDDSLVKSSRSRAAQREVRLKTFR